MRTRRSSRGPTARRSVAGSLAILAVLTLWVPSAFAMRMTTGTYTGNGVPQATATPFQPDLVIVKGNAYQPAVIKTRTMPGMYSKYFDTSSSDGIRSLDAGGFTVGTSDAVNAPLTAYTFVAIEAAAGQVAVGSYVGNGATPRTVTGLAFSPAYVMVMSEASDNGVQRFALQPADESLMIGANAANVARIVAMTGDGFTVTNDVEVNAAGVRYHYVAFAASAGVTTGSYLGDSSGNRVISGLAFEPEFALVRSANPSANTFHRASHNGYDASMAFVRELYASDAIRDFVTAGFEIGARVNSAAATYYWLALRGTDIEADMALDARASRTSASTGDAVTITVEITNQGPDDATGLAATASLPAGFTYASHVASRGAYVPASGSWTVGSLAFGESVTLSINATVSAAPPATLSVNASVTALDQTDAAASNNLDSIAIQVVDREFRMVTGSYTGNGSSSRAVSGLGFAPDAVLVTGQGGAGSVMRTATMPAGRSKEVGHNASLISNGVTALNTDGFTVGNHGTANSNGVVYHWIAFQSAPGAMRIGSYVGNENDNRSITGMGFRPGYVIVMSSIGEEAMQRFAPMVGDASVTFDDSNLHPDRIQALEADGFQVGRHNTVNDDNETFHYVAWKDANVQARTGVYAGNGTTQTRSDVAFRPLHVIVRRQTSNYPTVQRSASITANTTLPFSQDPPVSNAITALTASGFTLGSHGSVNENGVQYYWSAMRDKSTVDASLQITASDPVPDVGDTLTFTVTASNATPSAATSVIVTSALVADMAFVSATPTTGSYSSSDGRWTIGTLAGSTSAILSLRARVLATGAGSTVTQSATVTSLAEPDFNTGNNSASVDVVVQAADLAIDAEFEQTFAIVGDTLRLRVGIANNGPHSAETVTASVSLPPLATYLSHSGNGTWVPGTGAWTVGSVPALGAATMTIVARVAPGAEGQLLVGAASIVSSSRYDTTPANNDGSASVQVVTPVSLVDVAGSLYPATASAGQPALAIRIGIDNTTNMGVSLATTSTVSFSDGVSTYVAALANPTFLPAFANDFTLSFQAAAVPPAIVPDASYDLQLALQGTTQQSWAYADTFSTAGRNAMHVTTAQMVVTAGIVGDVIVHPGDTRAELMRLLLQSPYDAVRTLDSLVVTNTSIGASTQAELDGLTANAHLYGDADGNGTLTGPDPLLATTRFVAGRAVFDVGGAWQIPPASLSRLLVAVDVDSTQARDGDRLDVAVLFESDIVFVEPTLIAGIITPLYPLNSYGTSTIDGMVAAQIRFAAGPVDTLTSADADAWIGTLVLPTNGYSNDVLQRIEIADFSGNFESADLAALDLVLDDGNGVFAPGIDMPLGRFVFSGDRYQLSGLSTVVTPATKFFLVASVAAAPVDFHTFRPGVPTGGAQMASGNDGPLDTDVVLPRTIVFRTVDEIAVTARPLGALSLRPGHTQAPMLGLTIRNQTAAPAVVNSLLLTNASTGAGGTAQLDGNFADIAVYADNGDGVVGPSDLLLAGALRFSGDTVTATSLGLTIPPGVTASLLIAGDVDSSCAADGDLLAIALASPAHISVSATASVSGTFPIATTLPRPVDGMVAHQVRVAAMPDTVLVAGSNDVLVLDFRLHGNGYLPDVLQSLIVQNIGSATEAHVSGVQLYRDGGDGRFDAGADDDVALGALSPIGGNRYRITGTSAALPGTCGQDARFFVSADIVSSPPGGASFRLSIPTSGIAVASGNDGPIDEAIVSPATYFIPTPDELTVFPYSVGDTRVRPGAHDRLNFGSGLYNGFDAPLTLEGIALFQKGSAAASEVAQVRLWADQDGNGLFDPNADALLAATTSTDVFYTFTGLGLALPPKRITYLFASYDLSLAVRDSVGVNLQLNSESDLMLPGLPAVQGEFPVDSPGEDITDGMITAQIEVADAPNQTVPPGEPDVFVIGFTVPRNGLLPDALERVAMVNAGTAVAGQDIVLLKLWVENNGNTTFQPGGDRLVTALLWNGSSWTHSSPFAESVPTVGLRCYVSAAMAATAVAGRTVRGSIPQNGLEVASANDGPIDGPVVNAGSQVVSTDPLIASVSTDRASYSVGQLVQVTMNVRNVGGTTLDGAYPASLSASGGGSVSLLSGPVPPSANIDPGETVTFSWTFAANAAGGASFCGSASDTMLVSVTACAAPVTIETRPVSIESVFDDRAPFGVNRGQRGVPIFSYQVRHGEPDSLAAAVRIGTVTLEVTNGAGSSAIAPNTVLSGVTLVSSSGSNTFFTLVDSTTTPLRLALPQPIRVQAGESVAIDVLVDVAASAVLAPFRLTLAAPGDLGIVDDNDGAPVAISPSPVMPWLTQPVNVDDPATVLLVSDDVLTTATANVGQTGVVVWEGTMENNSPATAARASVTALTLDFHDAAGTPIAPRDAITRLAVYGDGAKLFETSELPAASTARFDFSSPLLLDPQTPRSFAVEADIHGSPATGSLGITLRTPAVVVVRDDNSGLALTVQGANGATFPLVSRSVALQAPATGLAASLASLSPGTMLPAMTDVEVARLLLSHIDIASSSIVVDSLTLAFRTPDGAGFFPGNYFDRVVVMGGAGTLATISNLSSVSSLVPVRLSTPIALGPATSDSLTIRVDVKSSYVPSSFVLRLDRELIHAVDANDRNRLIGISGAFPLLTNPCNLRLQGNAVFIAARASVPGNVVGNERALHVADIEIDNRSAPGFTEVRFDTLTISVQGRGGSPLPPAGVLAAAQLWEADSLVCQGTMTPNGVVFALPSNFLIAPATKRTLDLLVDLAADAETGLFRFAVRDAAAVQLTDAASSSGVTVASEAGFPLTTSYTSVLGGGNSFTNYPNPFAGGRETTRVTFFLDRPSQVTLRLLTLWGDPVTTLESGSNRGSGLHQDVTWDGRNGDGDVVANGVYYLVLDITPDAGTSQTFRRKVAVLR